MQVTQLKRPVHSINRTAKGHNIDDNQIVKDKDTNVTTNHTKDLQKQHSSLILFSKQSIVNDIEKHSHSSICCAAVIGKPVICHTGGH